MTATPGPHLFEHKVARIALPQVSHALAAKVTVLGIVARLVEGVVTPLLGNLLASQHRPARANGTAVDLAEELVRLHPHLSNVVLLHGSCNLLSTKDGSCMGTMRQVDGVGASSATKSAIPLRPHGLLLASFGQWNLQIAAIQGTVGNGRLMGAAVRAAMPDEDKAPCIERRRGQPWHECSPSA